MGEAKTLFPFRGQMSSAYQIAKAYGMQEDYWMIQHRLMNGMSAEEAVKDAQNAKRKASPVLGIRHREINRLRTHLKPGDKLRVRMCSSNKADTEPIIRWETCRVIGTYPYVVTLRRTCGLWASKTYVDLIQEGVHK